MAIAKRPGGLYVVNGKAVNAEGVAVLDENGDALPITPDTIPSVAVAAAPLSATNIADQIADGVARALALVTAPAAPADKK